MARNRRAEVRWALRAKRLERRWTQEETAKCLGISRSFYSMIELDQRNPTLGLAKRIAQTFNLDLDTLFF